MAYIINSSKSVYALSEYFLNALDKNKENWKDIIYVSNENALDCKIKVWGENLNSHATIDTEELIKYDLYDQCDFLIYTDKYIYSLRVNLDDRKNYYWVQSIPRNPPKE